MSGSQRGGGLNVPQVRHTKTVAVSFMKQLDFCLQTGA